MLQTGPILVTIIGVVSFIGLTSLLMSICFEKPPVRHVKFTTKINTKPIIYDDDDDDFTLGQDVELE